MQNQSIILKNYFFNPFLFGDFEKICYNELVVLIEAPQSNV